jgi:hypothetical protein
MYFDRQTIYTEGIVCKSLLAPQPPEGGAMEANELKIKIFTL